MIAGTSERARLTFRKALVGLFDPKSQSSQLPFPRVTSQAK